MACPTLFVLAGFLLVGPVGCVDGVARRLSAERSAPALLPDAASQPLAAAGPKRGVLRQEQLWNTYYWMTREEDFGPGDDVALYDSDCDEMATVSQEFFETICVEGSGMLLSGELLNWADTCDCGDSCPAHGLTVCYTELDTDDYPWGAGTDSSQLEPLVSWAVGEDFYQGTVFFVEQIEGVAVPLVDDIGGFVHDGCFRADDVGVGVEGDHFDFFAGTHGMFKVWETLFPTNTYFTVHIDDPRCDYLTR
ncbi:MAG: hypothetical protein V3V08_10210 [Nannocystaceae bacterium]